MQYQDFREKWLNKMKDRTAEGELATFVPNKQTPIYNWFYYKEGFSRELVLELIDIHKISETVLDPFVGSGTTSLACKERGIDSIGIDVLPISVFATQVKTKDYDIEQLETEAKLLLKKKFRKLRFNVPPIMKRSFNKYVLEDVMFFRSQIVQIDPSVRDFFLLALVSAANKCSYARKDGAVIKFRKKNVPPLRSMLRRTIYRMIKDMKNKNFSESQTVVRQGDARFLKMDDNSVSAVITSPPYLNNIDYTKVYAIEEFIIGGRESPSIRSYIGAMGKGTGFSDIRLDAPPAAVSYFDDMRKSLQEMKRVCRDNSPIMIVVGNGYFPELGEIVESDLIIAFLAEQMGMKVEKIEVLNKRYALENRTKKKGILRESMITVRV